MKLRTSSAIALMGSSVLILGALFKYLHWPGANIQIAAGTVVVTTALFSLSVGLLKHRPW